MAVSLQSVYPVRSLQQTFASLEAAVMLCLVKPKKEAVHGLRTSTRRAEAQLALLEMLPHVPPHKKQANAVRKLLKKLRRAAGRVRDLDVQRKLIQDAQALHEAADDEARHLRDHLKQQRKYEAKRLLKSLHKQQDTLPVVLDALLEALQPAASLVLSPTKLMQLVRHWYDEGAPAKPDLQDPEQLHTIRKRAKLARYLAESAPAASLMAHRLAAQFEALQEAGGTWHDWLLLGQLAGEKLGSSAVLPGHYESLAQNALRTYRKRLRRAR